MTSRTSCLTAEIPGGRDSLVPFLLELVQRLLLLSSEPLPPLPLLRESALSILELVLLALQRCVLCFQLSLQPILCRFCILYLHSAKQLPPAD